uniref:Uncharacterized protein n=1 Tax=Arion vulgaris TaxID=1028688 RepID=A0A0B7BND1_9EUPU
MCFVLSEEWGSPGEGLGPDGLKHIIGGDPIEEVGECICCGPGDGWVEVAIGIPPGPKP